MNEIYESYLFEKHILVHRTVSGEKDSPFETVFALANLFGIRILSGHALAEEHMIRLASAELGQDVPEPFYRGFPESVRKLSPNKLLFDQLFHYTVTYGFGDFSKPGHSLYEGDFEKDFERTAFKEKTEVREFRIVTEEEALHLLGEMVDGLLAGTRPLSDRQYELVKSFLLETDHPISFIASKNTAVRLLLDTRSLRFADTLYLSDVIRLTDRMNYQIYGRTDLRKLNLRNQDRKLIAQVIDHLLEAGRCDLRTCYEKKKLWNGLLHHLHYKPKTPEGRAFTDAMRGKGNESVYSEFERAMEDRSVSEAARILRESKGSGAVLRNLNYLISRCESEAGIQEVLSCIDSKNTIVLLQLLFQYGNYKGAGEKRTFCFTKYEKMKIYTETEQEAAVRKSVLSGETVHFLEEEIRSRLERLLKNRLGKVYIAPEMWRYALPIQETASQGGFGVLTRGTRIPIPVGKKLRAFTYWEKVDDIDLSVFGIDSKGCETEFSWRTMAGKQSKAITYSGDETSGYNGGSEYFDIDFKEFFTSYPDVRYLVFCNNVFSGLNFSQCVCRAGFMLRDTKDSGRIYEPKTVQSAYTVNCESTFAYLFGIDLETNEMVWLNMSRNGVIAVAGDTGMKFLTDYFHLPEVLKVGEFFRLMATELVEDPAEADVVVTDQPIEVPEGVEVIREYDFERMLALMN